MVWRWLAGLDTAARCGRTHGSKLIVFDALHLLISAVVAKWGMWTDGEEMDGTPFYRGTERSTPGVTTRLRLRLTGFMSAGGGGEMGGSGGQLQSAVHCVVGLTATGRDSGLGGTIQARLRRMSVAAS
jgi:hypothetical protein